MAIDLGSRAVAAVRAAGRAATLPFRAAQGAVEASPYGQPGPDLPVRELGPWDYSPATAAVNLGLRILAEARGRANWRERQRATQEAAALDAEYKRAQIGKLQAQSVPDAEEGYSLDVPVRQPLPAGFEGPEATETRTVRGLTGNQFLTQGRAVGVIPDAPSASGTPREYPSRLFAGKQLTHGEYIAEENLGLAKQRVDQANQRISMSKAREALRGAELDYPEATQAQLRDKRVQRTTVLNWNQGDTNAPAVQAAEAAVQAAERQAALANIGRFKGRLGTLAATIMGNPLLARDTELLKAVMAAAELDPADENDPTVGALLAPLFEK